MTRPLAPLVAVACALAGCSDDGARKSASVPTERTATTPSGPGALADQVRARYRLATADADPATGGFRPEARGRLEGAIAAWQRYLHATDKPDDGLAAVALQSYVGLTKLVADAAERRPLWQGASEAAEIIASARETPEAYVQLVEYASLADQVRKADLAGQHAIALAPARQRAEVRQAVKQAKLVAATQGP